jgi:hypothetical protein
VQWLNKYSVLNDSDIHSLEASAAAKEFKERLPREQAEDMAYQEYLRGHAVSSMAHHYQGGKIAKLLNDDASIQQHGLAYESAAKKCGFDMSSVPPEVLDQINGMTGLYKFKAHASDVFFPSEEAPQNPAILSDTEKVMQVIEGLKRLRGII